jgi:hypothetical protein
MDPALNLETDSGGSGSFQLFHVVWIYMQAVGLLMMWMIILK